MLPVDLDSHEHRLPNNETIAIYFMQLSITWSSQEKIGTCTVVFCYTTINAVKIQVGL